MGIGEEREAKAISHVEYGKGLGPNHVADTGRERRDMYDGILSDLGR